MHACIARETDEKARRERRNIHRTRAQMHEKRIYFVNPPAGSPGASPSLVPPPRPSSSRGCEILISQPHERLPQRLLVLRHEPRHGGRRAFSERGEIRRRRIVPERRQRPHDLRQRPRRQSRPCVTASRASTSSCLVDIFSPRRDAPHRPSVAADGWRTSFSASSTSLAASAAVRRRRLMPGASARAQQLGALRAVEPSFAVAFGTLLGTVLGTPERRGVRADDVISGVDAQHPPRVHHREPILLLEVVDEATPPPRPTPACPRARVCVEVWRTPSASSPASLRPCDRRGAPPRWSTPPSPPPAAASRGRQRPKDAIQIFGLDARRAPGNLALHRLHVRRRRRTIHLRARPQTLREVQHARHAPEILRRRLLEQRVERPRAARLEPRARPHNKLDVSRPSNERRFSIVVRIVASQNAAPGSCSRYATPRSVLLNSCARKPPRKRPSPSHSAESVASSGLWRSWPNAQSVLEMACGRTSPRRPPREVPPREAALSRSSRSSPAAMSARTFAPGWCSSLRVRPRDVGEALGVHAAEASLDDGAESGETCVSDGRGAVAFGSGVCGDAVDGGGGVDGVELVAILRDDRQDVAVVGQGGELGLDGAAAAEIALTGGAATAAGGTATAAGASAGRRGVGLGGDGEGDAVSARGKGGGGGRSGRRPRERGASRGEGGGEDARGARATRGGRRGRSGHRRWGAMRHHCGARRPRRVEDRHAARGARRRFFRSGN